MQLTQNSLDLEWMRNLIFECYRTNSHWLHVKLFSVLLEKKANCDFFFELERFRRSLPIEQELSERDLITKEIWLQKKIKKYFHAAWKSDARGEVKLMFIFHAPKVHSFKKIGVYLSKSSSIYFTETYQYLIERYFLSK